VQHCTDLLFVPLPTCSPLLLFDLIVTLLPFIVVVSDISLLLFDLFVVVIVLL